MELSPTASELLKKVKSENCTECADDIEVCSLLLKCQDSDESVSADSAECVICEVKFVNSYEARVHSMIHSENHTCFVCKQYIKNRFQFVGHVRKHMCSKPFLCPDNGCDKIFANARETKLHRRVHSEDRPYMCTECGKAFKQISTLKDHEVVHTGEKRFKCKICEGAFATATSLRRHVRVMHEAIRTFLCHFCEEPFPSKESLNTHLAVHKDIDPLKCQLCGEKLPSKEEFATHKNKHVVLKESGYCEYCANKTFYFALKDHIVKQHQPRWCKICNLVFYDEKSLENHQISHQYSEQKDDLTCHICKKKFEFPRYLKAHLKRHEDDYKKFICELCKKAFSSKRDLHDHLMVHANIKNYHCDVCNKAFRTKQSVNKHMPIHSDKRPFKCKICLKQFKKQSILRKHLITHSRLRPYFCELCGKSYKSKESLRVHRISHQRDKYHCKLCAKSFKYLVFFKHHCCSKTSKNPLRKKCYICGGRVKSIFGWSRHIFNHAKIGSGFNCSVCNGGYKYRYKLMLHYMTHKTNEVS